MTETTTEARAGVGEPLAVVCGGGRFPFAVAQAATRAGRSVTLFPIRGFADPWVEEWPHEWVPLGAFGALSAAIRRAGCRDVVIVGALTRPRLLDIRLDFTTVRLLPRIARLFRGGDDHLLSGVGAIFEEAGFRLRGAHEIAPGILVPEGRLGARAFDEAMAADARLGLAALAALGPYDVGQALVVIGGHVVAVEAAEGTDLMLERVADLRRRGRLKTAPGRGVLVKAPKPGQDRRIDLPSVGPQTVERTAAAGLGGLALEAGGVIAADLQAMIEAADRAGLALAGLAPR
ncbi:LpxI family protein [Prosthecomicrobium pneumaticum]|uniref:UDP-2,3-diacylglucosamine pyrophosphatase n=1 Tax=Prosthecomicrobium pneumaticum TaxID=81895 RepID=A0A7W9CSY8_9HYPH|nr:UDP-2,3-diacylglucosamine diphosphatase LpxI [Prosthecomicrobium pneumaticum]MBB5751310.1 hypothetical protein [Prosthecomicrobium pneumaticum]